MTSAGIMPRIKAVCAVVVVGACAFEASYGNGKYKCSDGACPSGLTCTAGYCVKPGSGLDSGSGSADAGMPDGPAAMLTCGVPGVIGSGSGPFTFSDDTTNRTPKLSGSCNTEILNGNDAVYELTATSGETITFGIAAAWAAKVYAISMCTNAPEQVCVGSALATPGVNAAFIAPAAGNYFIVVDGQFLGDKGTYTLSVAK